METFKLWGEILEAGGDKRIAHAVGRDVSTTYRWGRHKCDVTDPDGTGTSGLLDWFEAVIYTLGARRSGRVVLRKLRDWVLVTIADALGEDAREESPEQMRIRATAALRELADVIEECSKSDPDEARLVTECAEVADILQSIQSAAAAGLLAQQRAARSTPMRVS